LNFFIKLFTNDNYSTANIINDIVLYLKQFITIVIVVIPEGLPLVISMSLAYSVSLMKKDGLLIKKLDCPETNAKINQILIGKTGTLTTGELKVKKFWVNGQVKENVRSDTLYNSKLSDEIIDLIEDSILYNSDARIEINDQSKFEPVGNNTEVALLKLLQDCEIKVHHLIKRKTPKRIFHHEPFCSEKKYSIIALDYKPGEYDEEGNDDGVRVFIKGMPEKIIRSCSYQFNE